MQKSHEKVTEFYTRLQLIARKCEFSDSDLEIKRQLIQGTISARLRRKAIEQSLTLDQILKNARAMEAAEEQTIQIEKEQSNAVQYRVHTKSHYPKPVSEAKRSSQCGLCGGSYPHKGQCPAKGRRCLTCDKLNHFAKMCRSRAVSNEKPAQKKSYRRPKQRARAVTRFTSTNP